MRQYLEHVHYILENGALKSDRTGTGTKSVFGWQSRYDLSKGFPMMTTKKIPLRIIRDELLWFLKGETNIRPLLERNVNIWNDWPYKRYCQETGEGVTMDEFKERILADEGFAEKWGDLGPVYGYQWRNWSDHDGNPIDQISRLVEQLKTSPDSRRMIVSAWNVADIEEMAKSGLPPCHTLFQCYVADGKLSLQLYQRSADMFLGVPFNIASYALLTHMLAQVCGYEPGEFIHTFGDSHVYLNHIDQMKLQLSREPKALPELKLNPEVKDIFDFTSEDIDLDGYDPHPHIKGDVAV